MPRAMTITEKILAASADLQEVSPGQLINAKVDLAYTMDFMGKVVFDKLHQLGTDRVFDRDKVVVIFRPCLARTGCALGRAAQPCSRRGPQVRSALITTWGGTGVMHHMVAQEGHLAPGMVALGTDSHAPTGGAMGAVALGIGATDIAVAMAFGRGLAARSGSRPGPGLGRSAARSHGPGHLHLPDGPKGLGRHRGGVDLPGDRVRGIHGGENGDGRPFFSVQPGLGHGRQKRHRGPGRKNRGLRPPTGQGRDENIPERSRGGVRGGDES